MRILEMYLTGSQIAMLSFLDVEFNRTNITNSNRQLVTFDSQEQFNKAFRMLS